MNQQQSAPPVVVVGASAGGVEALRELAAGLPADFPACVLVVLHIPASSRSALPMILDRAGVLPARHAAHGERLEAGTILVAPPDHHLIVADGHVTLTHGPQENGHRPAVDPLFRSAARSHRSRAVAVVLSGSLDDGAAGMLAVTHHGGSGVVQDFDEALYAGMPSAAARVASVKSALVADIPAVLTEMLDNLEPATPRVVDALIDMETEMSELDPHAMHQLDRPGVPAGFGCPECAGSLYRIEEGELVRFRCRVGHAWSSESLLQRQGVALESALWMALRSLEEKAALNSELEQRAVRNGHHRTAARYSAHSEDAFAAAEQVRQLLDQLGGMPTTTFADEAAQDLGGGLPDNLTGSRASGE